MRQNDVKSQTLLDKEDGKRSRTEEDSSAATPARSVPSGDETDAQSLSGYPYPSLSDVHTGKSVEVESSSTKLGHPTQEGDDSIRANLISTGYSYYSMTKECYQGPNATVYLHLHVTCLNRPTLIGGTVVYEADDRVIEYEGVDQSERSELKPVVRCFTENVEAPVPKELVRFE